MKKKCQKTNQTQLKVDKVIDKKCDKVYDKWKSCDNSFNSWIDKKISLYKVIIQNQIVVVKKKKVESYLSNYAIKSDVNKRTEFHTLDFARNTNLSSVKSEVSKLDTDNTKTVHNCSNY